MYLAKEDKILVLSIVIAILVSSAGIFYLVSDDKKSKSTLLADGIVEELSIPDRWTYLATIDGKEYKIDSEGYYSIQVGQHIRIYADQHIEIISNITAME